MSRAERALKICLVGAAIEAAERVARERGQQLETSHRAAVEAFADRILDRVILGLRESGPEPTPLELSEVTREIALAAIDTTLGPPTPGAAN